MSGPHQAPIPAPQPMARKSGPELWNGLVGGVPESCVSKKVSKTGRTSRRSSAADSSFTAGVMSERETFFLSTTDVANDEERFDEAAKGLVVIGFAKLVAGDGTIFLLTSIVSIDISSSKPYKRGVTLTHGFNHIRSSQEMSRSVSSCSKPCRGPATFASQGD